MRVSLLCLSVCGLVACESYKHTAVSGSTLEKMESLTLSQDKTKRILTGQEDIRSYAEGAEVVTVPLEFNGRLPAVQVRLNGGKPQQMVIDSGASLSVLEAEDAVKAGIQLCPPACSNFRPRA
jgi:predicted aspartyl protease